LAWAATNGEQYELLANRQLRSPTRAYLGPNMCAQRARRTLCELVDLRPAGKIKMSMYPTKKLSIEHFKHKK
jgi:hypothetical protein